MKNFGFTININKNSNTIIGHSESDWSNLRNNSLISIDNDTNFYTIGKVEPLNFITDFSVQDNNLIINGNFEHYFIFDDILTISYKEYELLTIKEIINNGINYKIGDTLSLEGGILSIDIVDNKSHPSILRVEEIGPNGEVNKLKVIHKGIFLEFPNKNNKLTGGSGQNIEISIESNIISNRKMIERQIANAKNDNSNTIIELNYNLPANIKEGKISVYKYIGYLTSNYIGPDKRNVSYNIVRDFSPYLEFPLLVKGSNKVEETYNYTILKLEKELQDIREKLKKLI